MVGQQEQGRPEWLSDVQLPWHPAMAGYQAAWTTITDVVGLCTALIAREEDYGSDPDRIQSWTRVRGDAMAARQSLPVDDPAAVEDAHQRFQEVAADLQAAYQ